MKVITTSHVAISLGAFLFLSGCSKQEPAPAPATSANQPSKAVSEAVEAAQKGAETAVAEVKKQAGEIKDAAQAAVADAKKEIQTIKAPEVTPPSAPATPAGATTTSPSQSQQVMAVLEQAKGLYNEKKYPEALTTLTGLSNVSLTAEQQNMFNQLKTQISNAMASQAGHEGLKSVGGLLQQNK